MQRVTRYALERDGVRFAPERDGVVGFASATEAMLHVVTFMPNEAHLWHWVPVHSCQATETGKP